MLGLALLVVTAGKEAAAAPTHLLAEKIEVGAQTHTRFHLVIRGKLNVENRQESIAGQALLEYPERILAVGADGLASRSARYYEDARAKFVVGNHEDPRQLRVPLRLMIAESTPNGLEHFSPAGPMTSDERELLEDVLDTTRLPGLLPRAPIAVGGTFAPEPNILVALCGLKHFIASTVEGKLESMDAASAVLRFAGEVHGLALGTEVKCKIDATVNYDVPSGFIESVVWTQTDSRGPSPISPPGTFEVKISIQRKREASPRLSDAEVARIEGSLKNPVKLLVFNDPQQRFRFLHDRHWHVTMQTPERSVLRRMNDGDFVAQLNITAVEPSVSRAKMTPEQLQAMVEQAGGWRIEEVVRTDSISTDAGAELQLVVASGTSGKLKLNQRHYLATLASGRQVIFSFLVEPQNEAKLGSEDMSLVHTVEFPSQTASKPAAAQTK